MWRDDWTDDIPSHGEVLPLDSLEIDFGCKRPRQLRRNLQSQLVELPSYLRQLRQTLPHSELAIILL